MKNQSLNSIMNQMALGMQSNPISADDFARGLDLKPLDELEAFATQDGTLNSLLKQYLDSKAQRKELVAKLGIDDAMSIVALDMEDSNWCAMQTRYLELRENRELMAKIQVMMRQRLRDIEDKKIRAEQLEKERRARDFVNYLKIMDIMKKKNKAPQVFEWAMAFIFLGIDVFGIKPNKYSYHYSNAA